MLIVGLVSMLLLNRIKNSVKPIANLLVLAVPLVLLSLHFSESLGVSFTSFLGRDSTFTGRTTIWSAVSDVASRNPLFGVGYGGYWGLEDEVTSTIGVKEGHNGYLDVYLDAGIVGIVLLFTFLLAHYRKVLREINHSYDWGVFGICSLVMLLLANYTEGSFLKSSFIWSISVFLTIVFSAPYLYKNGD
jgi:O-antigen ligase